MRRELGINLASADWGAGGLSAKKPLLTPPPCKGKRTTHLLFFNTVRVNLPLDVHGAGAAAAAVGAAAAMGCCCCYSPTPRPPDTVADSANGDVVGDGCPFYCSSDCGLSHPTRLEFTGSTDSARAHASPFTAGRIGNSCVVTLSNL